jgi:hypothetical protein
MQGTEIVLSVPCDPASSNMGILHDHDAMIRTETLAAVQCYSLENLVRVHQFLTTVLSLL